MKMEGEKKNKKEIQTGRKEERKETAVVFCFS